ncbi:DUF1493 family protein [Spirosoma endbachense]|uniref:DUF1493 family protein n=1 Tax=Spirosoma endbachense TaxID=2666025 RepID=A0A6P1VYF6_9BACT|nr:DUF1493 family protein [Spirosoma endbachense]QHV98241.1 DUF1493 family protein [Spirosoma endbachense]
MNSDIERELLAFINQELGTKFTSLENDAEVEKRLRIGGDDTLDFILAFSKRFDIDISEFEPANYFAGEGLMLDFIGLFKRLKGEKIPKLIPLTFGDLKKAMLTKKLV